MAPYAYRKPTPPERTATVNGILLVLQPVTSPTDWQVVGSRPVDFEAIGRAAVRDAGVWETMVEVAGDLAAREAV